MPFSERELIVEEFYLFFISSQKHLSEDGAVPVVYIWLCAKSVSVFDELSYQRTAALAFIIDQHFFAFCGSQEYEVSSLESSFTLGSIFTSLSHYMYIITQKYGK